MPKGEKQKLKLYYLALIMTQKTDMDHGLSMPEIQKALEAYGATADRKSLYDDLETLQTLGIDIKGEKEGKRFLYRVCGKKFDIAELKLLVDAIQSSKFITEKKSNDLIKKLTSMASEYEASQLKRQVVVKGRVKTMNESIYYIVDDLHRAIAENKQIQFDYMRWNLNKEMEKRKDEPYKVSPWSLSWDDENYYMIAYDEAEDKIKHFRVDKMKNIRILNEKRAGRNMFKEFDLPAYAKMSFGMYGGEKVNVRIAFKNEKVGIFLDRFGKDIIIHKSKEKGWSEIHEDIAVSDQFLGWIFALGEDVKIVGPDEVVDEFKKKIDKMRKLYK